MSTSLTSSIEKLVTTLELRAIREAAYSKNKEAMDSSSEIAETIRHHLSSLQQHSEALAGTLEVIAEKSRIGGTRKTPATTTWEARDAQKALDQYRTAFPKFPSPTNP